jgi:hypothetical protein
MSPRLARAAWRRSYGTLNVKPLVPAMQHANLLAVGRKRLELTGKKFGLLTVTGFAGMNKWHQTMWTCACKCGRTTKVCGSNLVHNKVRSCRCKRPRESQFRRVRYLALSCGSVCTGTTALACHGILAMGVHHRVAECVVLPDEERDGSSCRKEKIDAAASIRVGIWLIEPDAILDRIIVLEKDSACVWCHLNLAARFWSLIGDGDGRKLG